MIKIKVLGAPIAKKRPRFVRRGKFVGAYNAQETEESRWLWQVRQQMGDTMPLDGPLDVRMWFFLPRPKYHFGTGRNAGCLKASAPRHHTTKPDIDNLEKFVLDCLNGVAFKDDKQIVRVDKAKLYSTNPRTEIVVKGVSQIA